MPRVNLLPWREEQRRKRQQRFVLALCIAVCTGGLAVYIAKQSFQDLLEEQRARNDVLRAEIASLDLRIEQLVRLESHRDRLLARLRKVVELQRARMLVVHLFDELVEIRPAGVQLAEVEQNGNRVVLNGVAESSSRVAALMRNIDASRWLRVPRLELVETAADGVASRTNFTIVLEQAAIHGEFIQ